MSSVAEQRTASPALGRRMPDFFIVGHAKSGTTALYEMLRRHPQIFMPEYKGGAGKEPWYFSRDNPNPQRDGERNIAYTGRFAVSLEEYLDLFSPARSDQRLGEASSSYLWSPVAARRIHDACPDARIIAIFREPASFLRSLHLQLLQNRHEDVFDFRRAVELDDERRRNRHIPRRSYWPSALIYSDRVRYVEQLRRYHERFGRDRVLALIYDDFLQDNLATVRRVLGFLGVDDSVALEPVRANPTVEPRARAEQLRRNLRSGRAPVWRAVRTIGRSLTTLPVRERFFYRYVPSAIYRQPPPPDERFMLELRRRFKPEVQALSEYLQRDLVSLWGYDRIA